MLPIVPRRKWTNSKVSEHWGMFKYERSWPALKTFKTSAHNVIHTALTSETEHPQRCLLLFFQFFIVAPVLPFSFGWIVKYFIAECVGGTWILCYLLEEFLYAFRNLWTPLKKSPYVWYKDRKWHNYYLLCTGIKTNIIRQNIIYSFVN